MQACNLVQESAPAALACAPDWPRLGSVGKKEVMSGAARILLGAFEEAAGFLAAGAGENMGSVGKKEVMSGKPQQ